MDLGRKLDRIQIASPEVMTVVVELQERSKGLELQYRSPLFATAAYYWLALTKSSPALQKRAGAGICQPYIAWANASMTSSKHLKDANQPREIIQHVNVREE